MKFSFPFFGKKTQPEEQKKADIAPKDADVPFPEEEKVRIDWSAVVVDPMPGFEVLPEQVADPIGDLSAGRAQTSSVSAGAASPQQFSQQPSGPVTTNPVSEPEALQEETLDEKMPLQKVAVSKEPVVEPLEIHDLLITPAPAVSEDLLESNPIPAPVSEPELVLEVVEDVAPEPVALLVTETSSVEPVDALDPVLDQAPAPELVIEAVEDFVSEEELLSAPISIPDAAPVTELVIEAVEDFVSEPIAKSVSKVNPVEAVTTADPVITPQVNISSAPPAQTGLPASPPMPLIMTEEDVIAAYKIFLNRFPESLMVIKPRLNSPIEANLIDFALSDEFISRADLPAIVFPIAKKIIEASEKERLTNQASDKVVG